MVSRSPVVSFSEGIEVVTQRILNYSGEKPFIATVRGISGVGKSHFGREVVGRLYFQKQGTLVKPHDLERELSQKGKLNYLLLEIDEIDNPYEILLERKTKEFCGKIPDYRIAILYELAPLLDSTITWNKLLSFFDLIVENPENPNYT